MGTLVVSVVSTALLAAVGAAVTVYVQSSLGDPAPQSARGDAGSLPPVHKPAVDTGPPPAVESLPQGPSKQTPSVTPGPKRLSAGGITVFVPEVFRRGDTTQYRVEGDPAGVAWLLICSRAKGAEPWYCRT